SKTHKELPIGETGELIVKGPQIMKGYWNNPEATNAVLKDGWLFTGDIGYTTEDGFFYVVDRQDAITIAGGYNMYPRHGEEILFAHDGMQEAVVGGVSHRYSGETVMALIVLKDGYNLTKKEPTKDSSTYLAAYKAPRIYKFVKELPKT